MQEACLTIVMIVGLFAVAIFKSGLERSICNHCMLNSKEGHGALKGQIIRHRDDRDSYRLQSVRLVKSKD